jgi:hypothetical protein
MDVGDWLRSLVLGQHEAAFRDNVVDGAVAAEADGWRPERNGADCGPSRGGPCRGGIRPYETIAICSATDRSNPERKFSRC